MILEKSKCPYVLMSTFLQTEYNEDIKYVVDFWHANFIISYQLFGVYIYIYIYILTVVERTLCNMTSITNRNKII